MKTLSGAPPHSFFLAFFETTFSTYPAGSKGVVDFPDGCLHLRSHLFEVPEEKEYCVNDLECAKAR